MINRIFLLALTLVFSGLAYAHPGHDHNDPMAMLVHLLWLAPIAIALVVAVYLKKRASTENAKQDKSQGS
ncbi:hypothetical protein DXX93_07785 [Thalassotalea euphylliae]|uniref:Uncharacterized protein n=1 Tax=Thalassotalea euphylliae TaxID=1655234 RepID=A0A3E0TPX4_9GAMM|nr:hypothetical protein [Thalassotalea euphylliae]REL26493.1 hypothetical protein DXX93_07785 [Thalassotalea euphylliae]